MYIHSFKSCSLIRMRRRSFNFLKYMYMKYKSYIHPNSLSRPDPPNTDLLRDFILHSPYGKIPVSSYLESEMSKMRISNLDCLDSSHGTTLVRGSSVRRRCDQACSIGNQFGGGQDLINDDWAGLFGPSELNGELLVLYSHNV